MIYFKRAEGREWERWPSMCNPTPPAVDDFAKIKACTHITLCQAEVDAVAEKMPALRESGLLTPHGPKCCDWRGVHFIELRVDGRVWDRIKGWRS